MQISINTSKWYDRIWAAFIFFTRLPFWRIYQPPKDSFDSVVEYWPLTGWMTGCAMASTLFLGSMVFPWAITVILAIGVRILMTGALHEDGLADFIDGFGGGGTNRERILAIMKDSRIGTYGVIGLIFYCALLFGALYTMKPFYAMIAVMGVDPFCKMISGQIIQMMPYARNEEQSKAHVVYRKFSVIAGLILFAQGVIPLIPLFLWGPHLRWEIVVFAPCIVMYFLYLLIWHRLRGYTGDCCGAIFLLTELSTYLCIIAQWHL
jgi:adenosylcobinamide-GDP ribazoletransferase